MARRDQFDSRALASVRFVAQRGLLKSVVWSWTDVDIVGRSRVRGLSGAFIVVANHSSHLDAPLIMGALPRPLARYLASGAAADYFFDVKWRTWLTALFFNAFPVDRGLGQRSRPGMSKGLLERGVPLLIFPEGSRSRTGEMGAFKPGAAALAIACEVPVVPIALTGANVAMPRGRSWPVAGRKPVRVEIGAPLRAKPGESPEEFSTRLHAEISRMRADGGASASVIGKGRR
ncbi:lysophospholipid acyltransferase family protein [Galbitalea sp. SE-J8]|uniref:lysophospholipid acyltransferase family protein n=1 Tax=Galbitalea sp. SE-J8 TaxID=3054952 RepID=UPI00259D079F|nr:lysophospholipid acyltransferase family protein [Galbitalea sp. SE-J8]MDM4761771.1 lysophospholipid acyltransferase family protein [Galbitalea sp. SE-J8]